MWGTKKYLSLYIHCPTRLCKINITLALVGKLAMKKINLLSRFSWQHCILVNQQQHTSNRNAPKNDSTKKLLRELTGTKHPSVAFCYQDMHPASTNWTPIQQPKGIATISHTTRIDEINWAPRSNSTHHLAKTSYIPLLTSMIMTTSIVLHQPMA